jgi:UDP-N-acetylglucosamine 2-epimerase (non-hydrolysing)
VVFGTRPEAIKLAPVIQELRRRPGIRVRTCVTAQHRQLLDQVLPVFGLRPDFDLDIMTRGQTLTQITSRTLDRLTPVLHRTRPQLLFVQGDTTTALAAALAACYHRIPVAHVEAGLRTYDPNQPYPEELNRRLISPLAVYNFAPTPAAAANLRSERIAAQSVFVTGNTVIDALRDVAARLPVTGAASAGSDPGSRLILVTAHRRENFGPPLRGICQALLRLVHDFPDVRVTYPVHPNPNVRRTTFRLLQGRPRITLCPPLDYLPFIQLLRQSFLVLSDSGGIQEEAPALAKPVLVLRDTTERPEAVRAGTARLVGTDPERIFAEASRLLRSPAAYLRMARARNPFGDGRAAVRIADFLEYRHGLRARRPRPFRPAG